MNRCQYEIEELFASVAVGDFIQSCTDIPRIESYCRACSNYGRVWSCPSFDFSVEDFWGRYTTLELHARKLRFSQEMLSVCYEPQELGWKSKELLRPEQKRLLDFLLQKEGESPGSYALAAGSCDVCHPQPCLRAKGQPCIHPERMRYSLEALGADVAKTVEQYLHEQILWGRQGHLPEYYLLVGGLLRR